MAESKRKKKTDTESEQELEDGLDILEKFIQFDEETGEWCIGTKCFKQGGKPLPDGNTELYTEMDPNAKCSPTLKKIMALITKSAMEGKITQKIRQKMVVKGNSNG